MQGGFEEKSMNVVLCLTSAVDYFPVTLSDVFYKTESGELQQVSQLCIPVTFKYLMMRHFSKKQ